MELKDKNIVLTGGSSGIGKSLLERLLDEGANIFAVSRTIEESLDFTHERLVTGNLDLSVETEMDRLFIEAFKHFDHIDLFIANAGFAYYEMLEEASHDHIDKIMKTNTHSVIHSAVKMREHHPDQPFHFLAVLSAASMVPMPGNALYCASKAALKGFFDAFRLELEADQFIHTVFPVATKTDFFRRASQPEKPWPVQSVGKVSKAIVKGLKKDRYRIYPSKLFKWSYRLTRWVYPVYLRLQKRKFIKAQRKKR